MIKFLAAALLGLDAHTPMLFKKNVSIFFERMIKRNEHVYL